MRIGDYVGIIRVSVLYCVDVDNFQGVYFVRFSCSIG